MKKNRVLIIDDDDRSRSLLESHLLSMGFDPVFAKSSEEALTILSRDASFALIITDIMIPCSTSSEFARLLKLQEKTSMIPLIGTASFCGLKKIQDRDKTFFRGFLPKPVTRNILENEIGKLIKDSVAA
ncbi:MAG: response regulator [Nitrospirota bacterium]